MLYAAYGSNLHPVRIQQRTPSAKLLGTGAIADMALRFHKRGYRDFSGKCNIVPCSHSHVHVAIYDISTAEMSWLDRHEGAGAGYNRAIVSVNGFGECVSYIAAAPHIDERLSPFFWYKELVVMGCEKMRFPLGYIRAIRAIPAVRDLNKDRRNTHTQIVKKCKKGDPLNHLPSS